MNNKFPKRNNTSRPAGADEFQQERDAAKKKFTETDRKDFWKTQGNDGPRKSDNRSEKSGERKSYQGNRSEGGERKSYDRKEGGSFERKSFDRSDRPSSDNRRSEGRDGERKSYQGNRSEGGERKSYDRKEGGSFERKSFDRSDRPSSDNRRSEGRDGERKSYQGNRSEGGERKSYDRKEGGSFERKSFDRSDRPSSDNRRSEGRDGERKSYQGNRSEGGERKPYERKEAGAFGNKNFDRGDKPTGTRRGEGRFDGGKTYDRKEGGSNFGKKNTDRSDKSYGNKDRGADKEEIPEKKTFQDVMNSAFNDRGDFDKNRAKIEDTDKPLPQEDKVYGALESDGREDMFDEKGNLKSETKSGGKKGGERGNRKDSNPDGASSFLQHFDYEHPNEQMYDAKGNKGVRPEQQAFANMEIMPLNKFIAHCGVCSRRDAVELIKNGKITVNDVLAEEPGYKVMDNDIVKLDGKALKVQKNLVYALLNKPKGFITTTDDPKGRRTVMDIFGDNIQERMFPVGRLDRNTTGLLLLTNDGDLAQQLSHPKYENRKVYQVTLDKAVAKPDFEKILAGLALEDGVAKVDQLAYLDHKNEIGIEIHSGKNRIVRRIFEHLGYVVEKLDRVVYAGLTKKNLKRGQWRFLTQQEVINLKHLKKA